MSEYHILYTQVHIDEVQRQLFNLKNEVKRLFAENEKLRRFHDGCEQHQYDAQNALKRANNEYNELYAQHRKLIDENRELRGALQQAVAEGYRR